MSGTANLGFINRDLAMAMYSKTLVYDEAPNFEIKVKHFDRNFEPTYTFTPKTNDVVSIDISVAADYGASSATVVFETVYGSHTPDASAKKFEDEDWPYKDVHFFEKILRPENAIQISLGYGEGLIPVLTGAIDKFSVDAAGKMITIECRDNMRYLIDQTIDPDVHGRWAEYPKPDGLVASSQNSPSIRQLKVIDCSHLNVRSGPGTKYNIVTTIPGPGTGAETILEWLSTDATTGWHNVSFTTSSGNRVSGWVSNTYTEVIPNTQETATGINSAGGSTDDETPTEWLASAIVMDLAVEATTIRWDDNHPNNRTVCNVYTEQSIIDDAIDGILNFTIDYIKFPIDNSYFTACMEIVTRLGDVVFKCNRYGDLWLFRNPKSNQSDNAKWVLADYLNLTDGTYNFDVLDMRDRVLIKADDGWSLFQLPLITEQYFNGLHRTCCIEVKWADTTEKRLEAARGVYTQMLSRVRSMSVGFIGNPLLEIGDVCQLRDIVTTASMKYKILEIKHNYTRGSGFVSQCELEFITGVNPESIHLISEEFPFYKDKISYHLAGNEETAWLMLKSPDGFIQKATITLIDGAVNDIVCRLDIVADWGNGVSSSSVSVSDKIYVVVRAGDVNLRRAPDTSNKGNIKKVVNHGYKMEYLDRISASDITPPTSVSTFGISFAITPSEMNANAQFIFNFFKGKGWTDQSICGMLGNMQGECGLDPDLDEVGGGGGYGLVQWTPKSKLTTWAAGLGLDHKTLETQCRRIQWELQNNQQWITKSSYPLSFLQFTQSTQTPTYLAKVFIENYERPANTNQPQRGVWAEEWFTTFGGSSAPIPTPGTATNPTGDWYKVNDAGEVCYIWASYCELIETTTRVQSTDISRAATGDVTKFLEICMSQVGKPYVWGSTGPASFDCSGLIVYALRKMGLMTTAQRPTADYFYKDWVYKITKDELKPGDLFFCHNGTRCTHVGVYIGGAKPLLHASTPGEGVKVGGFYDAVNRFGRLRCLDPDVFSTNADITIPTMDSANVIQILPSSYIITSNYPIDDAPPEAHSTATAHGGEVLAYHQGHVLYKIVVDSQELSNNILRLFWANCFGDPVDIDLVYEVKLY